MWDLDPAWLQHTHSPNCSSARPFSAAVHGNLPYPRRLRQRCQSWKKAAPLPENTSDCCETRGRHQVSTDTLRWAGDKHLAARLRCRAALPAVPLHFLSPVLPRPHLTIIPSDWNVVQRIPQRPHIIHSSCHFLYIKA